MANFTHTLSRRPRFFYNPDTVSSFDFEVDFFGSKYNGNLNCYIDWSVYFYGAYEKENLFLYRDIARGIKEPIFLDVGTNIGHHSLFMSRYCDYVHSFEPYVEVSKKLEQKISKNNINNIVIHHVGLGSKNEELPYFAPKGCNTGTGSFISSHSSNNAEYGVLKIVDANEYISNLKLKKIDLIKIDVEGYEKNVLVGLKNIIAKYMPTIVMEFSNTTKDSFSSVDELKAFFPATYKIKRISENRPRWVFNSSNYRLIDFDFDVAGGDIVASPIAASFSRAGDFN